MIVSTNDGALRIEAENDVDYVLKNLPSIIADKQRTMPATAVVTVMLMVDGVYTNNLPGGRGLIKPADTEAVQKKLEISAKAWKLNSVRVDQVFSIRVTVTLVYELGECTGEQIVGDIKKRFKRLRSKGLRLQEPPPSDE